VLGEGPFERRDLAIDEIDLAQAPIDGLTLVTRELELAEPRAAALPNTSLIGGRPLRFRIRTACTSFLQRVR
jgi:hypothetical protein